MLDKRNFAADFLKNREGLQKKFPVDGEEICSLTYRLGKLLLSPFRWIKKVKSLKINVKRMKVERWL